MTGVVAIMAGSAPIQITATPPAGTGAGSGSTVQTNIVTISVSPPGTYDYLWSYVSGASAVDLAPTFALNSISQRWSGTGMNPGEDRQSTWRCDVSLFGTPLGSIDVGAFVQRL